MLPSDQHDRKIDMSEDEFDGTCSVCIATYRRPDLLGKLLRSLKNQILPERFKFEIVVVDNDAEKSAEPIVRKFQNSCFFNLHYFVQMQKNISLTRNMAVEHASGDYLLFIDDDEVASPKWLYHLVKTLVAYNADGVFGPVVPEFELKAPQWIKSFFYKTVPKTGATATSKWTSNCIIVSHLLKEVKGPFDVSYGITGGEDTHLFDRLEQKGARFVYCKEAWVIEFIPKNRMRLSYIFLRAMRGGNTHTRRTIEFSGTRHFLIRIIMVAKSITYGSISIMFLVCFFFDAVRRTKWLIKIASNLGRFLAALGWNYQGYR